MTAMAINFSDERLNELWNSREALNKKEWGELYQIIYKFLNVSNNKIRLGIYGLEGEIDDYINDFYILKVMRNFNAQEREATTRGHLTGFFKCFLIDQQRKEKKYFVNQSFEGDDDDDVKPQHEESKHFDFSPDEISETLSQFGFSQEDLTAKTKQFFDGLEEWQQVVITLHHCPDSIDSLTLSQLPQRYLQSATYYKVQQLGIIHKTNKLPRDYKSTVIGKWIHFSLGIRIEQENIAIIAIVFRILCVVALSAQDI
ncbi:MAG: hypothetical protein WBI40_10025 [Methylococcaceae bacterium]